MNCKLKKQQEGLTLLEVLITVALLSILIAGMYSMMSANQATSNLQVGVAKVQENGRASVDILSRELRMTGYLGCAQDDFDQQMMLTDAAILDFQNRLFEELPDSAGAAGSTKLFSNFIEHTKATYKIEAGLEVVEYSGQRVSAAGVPELPQSVIDLVNSRVLPAGKKDTISTDIITIRRLSNLPAILSTTTANKDVPLEVFDATTADILVNDIVYVTDCATKGSVVQITAVEDSNTTLQHTSGGVSINRNACLIGEICGSPPVQAASEVFERGSHVYKIYTTTYFVAPSGIGVTNMGTPANSLYRVVNSGQPQELIQGVKTINYQYGIDNTESGLANIYKPGDDDLFVNSANVDPFNDVVSIRVFVETTSVNAIEDPTLTDETNMIIQTFSQTVQLRNR